MARFLLLFATTMMWLQTVTADTCPKQCVCSTTQYGLHRATCSSLDELYKFTTANKHHNINILDLSHNNISKVGHQLDRLTEVVSLDLSTNGIEHLTTFLKNSHKLVHLKLANNRIKFFPVSAISESISSLDVSYNLLSDVPSDLYLLEHLEHLELEGNPIHCSCENLMARDLLLRKNIVIDHVKCASPQKHRGISWLQIKSKDVCKFTKNHFDDMMMGDQPDAEKIGDDASDLKSTAEDPFVETEVWEASIKKKYDDDVQDFIGVPSHSQRLNYMEGSGDSNDSIDNTESTTNSEEVIQTVTSSMDDLLEGSSEPGSGHVQDVPDVSNNNDYSFPDIYDYEGSGAISTTTEYFMSPFHALFPTIEANNGITNEEPVVFTSPKIFTGGSVNWSGEDPEITDQNTLEPKLTATVDENNLKQIVSPEESPPPKQSDVSKNNETSQNEELKNRSLSDTKKTSTGTYVCVSILVLLLVGLIGFAVAKSQIRKRRDRRLMRQQRKDIEKADKEMVDMNKSLLGKAAPADKINNGKYELVPTHETSIKTVENGSKDFISNDHSNGNSKHSPVKDNNQNSEKIPTANGTHVPPAAPQIHRDSLASDDIFVPDSVDSPDLDRVGSTDLSLGLLNGDNLDDSQFLSPTRGYVPVYSPDMGRVRIKITETPKPKTPVLVTRSRSNAGDIVITPSIQNHTATENRNAT